MLTLPELQQGIARALRHGPDAVPWSAFAGSPERVLLGFKVHANTISHGRLVALEETFPRLRTVLGEARFNRLSRQFVEAEGGKGEPLAAIGREFPEYLTAHRVGKAMIALARVEWAWLEAWRAAEARALGLVDLAGLDQTKVLALPVRRHPAARMVAVLPRTRILLGLSRCSQVLVTRPDGEMLLAPVSRDLAQLFVALGNPGRLGDLLALPLRDPLAALHAALAAGLIAPNQD